MAIFATFRFCASSTPCCSASPKRAIGAGCRPTPSRWRGGRTPSFKGEGQGEQYVTINETVKAFVFRLSAYSDASYPSPRPLSLLEAGEASRRRQKSVERAEQQEQMAPMVGVDLKALQNLQEEAGPDGDRLGLVGRATKHQAPAEIDCDRGQREEGEAADPAIGGEAVDIDVVRIDALEMIAELQRAEAEGPIEQHRDRSQLIAESAGLADIVILAERETDHEDVAHRGNGERDRQQHGDDGGAERREKDDPPPQGRRAGREIGEADHHRRRLHPYAPGAPREAQEQREQHDVQRQMGAKEAFASSQKNGLRQPDQRRRQERAEHVRILEGAGSAAVEGEMLAQSADIEIAEDGGEAGEDAGGDIARADDREPLERRFCDEAGEENRGDRNV